MDPTTVDLPSDTDSFLSSEAENSEDKKERVKIAGFKKGVTWVLKLQKLSQNQMNNSLSEKEQMTQRLHVRSRF